MPSLQNGLLKADLQKNSKKNWGFSINDSNKNTPWNRVMDKIYLSLHVVVNNGPDTAGGGGTPLMPFAPSFNSH